MLLAGQEHCDRLQFHILVSAEENKAGVSSSTSPGGEMLSTLYKPAIHWEDVGGTLMSSWGWKWASSSCLEFFTSGLMWSVRGSCWVP